MGHHHHDEPILQDPKRRHRASIILWALLAPIGVLALVMVIALWPKGTYDKFALDGSMDTAGGATMATGTVTRSGVETCPSSEGLADVGGKTLECTVTYVMPASGGAEIQMEIPPEMLQSRDVRPGDTLRYLDLSKVDTTSGSPYVFVDFVRTLPMTLLAIAYGVVVVLVAGWRGARAVIGLVGGIAFMIFFMVPALIEGGNPVVVGLTGATAIMFVALYFAHGLNAKTSTALLGTLFGLGVTAALALWLTDAAALTGANDESSMTLATVAPQISLPGLLICGVLVGGMGVLNDVTITQSATVWELAETSPKASAKELFFRGMRIGRDHIASTVYTIAFAYAGAALPILAIAAMSNQGFGVTLSSGEMAEEVIRILIGSIGLVLAIPVTTAIAVMVVKATGTGGAHGKRSLFAANADA
ncbi:YibE/F family protein [Glutamicibacter mishrai]|uniref:YibE/F family protein n=1 Tax=Glutamicibacter mishrai TaxID=1775880 RepID=A0A6H0SGB1_9MICC|nr:YibE/F family protein [Glutamicibacter mishrai]QIV86418.1 YibE/F family protein [Glutamicibacter mishrai]UTT39000.1 YibE/F family protein [Glutamicibacter mishrai]